MPKARGVEPSDDIARIRRYDLAIWSIAAGVLGYLICLVISILILPEGLRQNRGFSYYGDMYATLLPFRTAYYVCGAAMLLAAVILPRPRPFLLIRLVLVITCVLICLVALTTVPGTTAYYAIHRIFGPTLFGFLGLVGSWFALLLQRDGVNLALYAVFFTGGILSLLSFNGVLTLLIYGETVFLVAFGALLIYTLVKLRGV